MVFLLISFVSMSFGFDQQLAGQDHPSVGMEGVTLPHASYRLSQVIDMP
jgi:hypothetical protein